MRALAKAMAKFWADLPPLPRAALLALAASAFFSGMSAIIRHAAEDVHVLEVVFFRNFFGLVCMLPWLARVGIGVLRTDQPLVYGARGILALVSMLLGFASVTMIPLTEATALSFTAPLWITAGAALLLGERVRLRRWTAVIVGFLGAMLVLHPGAEALRPGAIVALVAAVFQAGSTLSVKRLARVERPETIVTWLMLMLTPMSLVPALFVWTWPSWPTLAWMMLLSGIGTIGHVFFTRAMSLADASVVMPFDFSRLLFTAAIAYAAFAEVPTLWTWSGGAVIFASTAYITRREAYLARQARGEVSKNE